MMNERRKKHPRVSFGQRVEIAMRESGDDWTLAFMATVLGPSSCKSPGRIGVLYSDGTIAVIPHISDAKQGEIGWMI